MPTARMRSMGARGVRKSVGGRRRRPAHASVAGRAGPPGRARVDVQDYSARRPSSLHSGLVGGSVDQDAMPREDFSMPPSNRTRPSSITRMRSYTSHRFASRRIEVGHQLTQEKQPARRRRDGHPDADARGHGADLRLAVHTGLPPERFLDPVDEPAVVHGRGEAHQFAHREAATERLVLLQGRQPGCSGSPGTSAPAPSSYGVACPHLRRGPEARTQDAFACSRPPPFAATTAR